jgi:hypothetical protein
MIGVAVVAVVAVVLSPAIPARLRPDLLWLAAVAAWLAVLLAGPDGELLGVRPDAVGAAGACGVMVAGAALLERRSWRSLRSRPSAAFAATAVALVVGGNADGRALAIVAAVVAALATLATLSTRGTRRAIPTPRPLGMLVPGVVVIVYRVSSETTMAADSRAQVAAAVAGVAAVLAALGLARRHTGLALAGLTLAAAAAVVLPGASSAGLLLAAAATFVTAERHPAVLFGLVPGTALLATTTAPTAPGVVLAAGGLCAAAVVLAAATLAGVTVTNDGSARLPAASDATRLVVLALAAFLVVKPSLWTWADLPTPSLLFVDLERGAVVALAAGGVAAVLAAVASTGTGTLTRRR